MARSDYLFTSESVSEGHPDKLCDSISDAIVDAFMARNSQSRVAAEALATTNRVILAGEVKGPQEAADPDNLRRIVRDTVRDIGYEQDGFHWDKLDIDCLIHEQSGDIAQGVDAADENEGAGDQGIMFGYACRETPDLMPAPIYYAHNILNALSAARRAGEVDGLGPDAKSQVTLKYAGGEPVGATTLVVSAQHAERLSQADVREIVREYAKKVLPEGWMPPEDNFYVNPTGRFVTGGPDGDAGLTGRKIIVDTYGGAALHGGGAFSGKDPSKVDRSAAYAARYLAKNVVAAELADRCTIQLSYAIGVAAPLSVYVDTHGTGRVGEDRIGNALRELMDLRPYGIRKHLDLNRPIFRPTANYGHFGRQAGYQNSFTWEKLDLVEALKAKV